jgi:hypothetical protein
MSPVLIAKELARAGGFRFNRLARLWFDDERINQRREDGGLTGFDTLVIAAIYQNDVWLSLWVDKGICGLPIAMTYQSTGTFKITGVYQKARFAKKLSTGDIQQIFDTIFSDISQINIIEQPSNN